MSNYFLSPDKASRLHFCILASTFFRFIPLLILFLIPIDCFSEQPPAETEDLSESTAVAEINSKKITRGQLDTEMERYLGPGFQKAKLKENGYRDIRKQFLNKLIERELLLDAALTKVQSPTDEQVEQFINEKIKTTFRSPDEFSAMLKRVNLSEKDFRSGIKNDLVINQYVSSVIYNGISVGDNEVKSEYESHKDQYKAPKEVRARHILFKIPESASESEVEKVKQRAEEVLVKAKKTDANFEKLAKEYSEDPAKSKGGDLGYFTQNQMVPPFGDVAFSLEPLQVSDLVRTRFGYHIIKVEDKRGGGEMTFDEAKEGIKEGLLAQKKKDALVAHIEELKKKGKVIIYLN